MSSHYITLVHGKYSDKCMGKNSEGVGGRVGSVLYIHQQQN